MRIVAILAAIALVGVVVFEFVLRDRGGGGGGSAGFESRGRLSVGSTATGTLADSDPRGRGNRGPYQVWTLRGERGEAIVVDMTSTAFDALLILRDADGMLVGHDDDSGDNLNARLRTILPRSGTYRLYAASVGGSARGDYTLTAGQWIVPDAPSAGSTEPLAVGTPRDGLLEPGDHLTADGPYQDRWSFEAEAGSRLRLEMRSEELDSYVMVYGPDGALVGFNDDGGRGRDAALVFRAPSAGRYTAVATSFGDHPRPGTYRVELTAVSGEFADPGAVLELTEGQVVTGQLEAGDSTRGGGGFADYYWFTPARTGSATFNLSSDDFDAVVELQDASGQRLASDDDGGGGRNARLVHPVTAGTRYRVMARAFGGSAVGTYRLNVLVLQGAGATKP
jgi:hypothetical protein